MGFKMTITHTSGLFGKTTKVEVENATPLTTEKELLELVKQMDHTCLKASNVPVMELPKMSPPTVNTSGVPDTSELAKPVTAEKVVPDDMVETTIKKPLKKTVDLIGSAGTGFSLGEIWGKDMGKEVEAFQHPADLPEESEGNRKAPEKPEWATDRVWVYVDCGECGHSGDQLTFPKNFYIKCRNCQEKLFLEKATDVRGEEDEHGYAFDANYKYKTRQELWEEENGVTS